PATVPTPAPTTAPPTLWVASAPTPAPTAPPTRALFCSRAVHEQPARLAATTTVTARVAIFRIVSLPSRPRSKGNRFCTVNNRTAVGLFVGRKATAASGFLAAHGFHGREPPPRGRPEPGGDGRKGRLDQQHQPGGGVPYRRRDDMGGKDVAGDPRDRREPLVGEQRHRRAALGRFLGKRAECGR